MSFGAKINLKNIELVKRLSENFSYVEIYFLPDFFVNPESSILPFKYVIHAPTHNQSVNLAKKSGSNIKFVESAIIFAHKVKAKRVIVHLGEYRDNVNEDNIIKNLRKLVRLGKKHNVKILIENVPLKAKSGKVGYLDFGSNPEEIGMVLEKVKCGFVLDFSHACHAALSYKEDYKKFILKFLRLEPEMFHLYDTIVEQEEDVHLPFGKGTMDIKFLVKLVCGKDVTLEMEPYALRNYIEAINYLKQIL